MRSAPFILARARPRDADAIAQVLWSNRDEPSLLLQDAERIRAHVDEFVVARVEGQIRGCAQLRRHRPTIVEIMSVAVDPRVDGRGIGRACVGACLERALHGPGGPAQLIWLATTSPAYFEALGFERTSMLTVPLTILLSKLRLVFSQPARRWWPAVTTPHVFMRWPEHQSSLGQG